MTNCTVGLGVGSGSKVKNFISHWQRQFALFLLMPLQQQTSDLAGEPAALQMKSSEYVFICVFVFIFVFAM